MLRAAIAATGRPLDTTTQNDLYTDREEPATAAQAKDGGGSNQWITMARPYLRLAKAAERRLIPLNLGLTSALILTRLASTELPQRMSDLAAYVEVEPQSITSLVDRLERVGFVQRAKHPSDRRAILLIVTQSGRETALRVEAALAETLLVASPL